jgi:hypothetical protein
MPAPSVSFPFAFRPTSIPFPPLSPPKDQTKLGQVAPVVAVLVKQLLFPLLEQLDRLLALLLQVLNKDFEVFIRVEQIQLVLK